MEYGKRLNPERSLRTPKGIKGTRQKVIVTHNPSEIDQNQELLVRFPNLTVGVLGFWFGIGAALGAKMVNNVEELIRR